MRLQLWIDDEANLRWRDPQNPFHRDPPAPFRHVADFPVDLWGRGITGNLRRLPGGALLATPSAQVYGYGGPRLLYLDQRRQCRDCRAAFTFSAAEQKHWYEVRKLWNEVEAHRCAPCRREFREERAGQARLMAAHRALKAAETPEAQLELAAATLAHARHVGRGALERALAAARKAARVPRLRLEAEDLVQGLSARLR